MKKYKAKTGMRTIINTGVVITITIITENALYAFLEEVLNASGILLSVASISLANLFKIRPIGVDSKNCILHLRIEKSIDSWSILLALVNIQANNESAPRAKEQFRRPSKK